MNDPKRPIVWHAMTAADVLAQLDATVAGLAGDEAARRLDRYGPNRLTPPKRRGPLLRLALQFHNVLIYVLLVAAAVTAALGHWIDTGVIVAVVLINAAIGFIQEGRAERALEAVRQMLSPHATALRDGRRIDLPAEAVVPGDVVILQSGDKVPADLRLLLVKSLQVQEAVLTGESVPAEKTTTSVPEDAALGDRACMAYAGTVVTHGYAQGMVVATGDRTEIGRISELLTEVQTLTTPLLRQMAGFGRWLTVAILALAAFGFGFGTLVRGFPATEMFMAGVGLAVAAIPEGLPAIITIALAIGVQAMARRNAIVRRLPAVEALGSVTVICSDKTGTLTRNELTARTVALPHRTYDVSGVGYDPHGDFQTDGHPASADLDPMLVEFLRAAALCNDSTLRLTEKDWVVDGDPTEGALLTLGRKGGLDLEHEAKACPRTDAIPFESEHRFMATLHHDHDGRGWIFVKGAPERVLAMCAAERTADGARPVDPAAWEARAMDIAGRGQRVLAVAMRTTDHAHVELRFADVESGLVLLGLVGFIDPPRTEAIEAVAACRTAGIGVKMITGDHSMTAVAIARELGLPHADHALTGTDLDRLDDESLRAAVRDVDVFARTSPEHKLRLVRALQAEGHVVAMTGDGVNDAPALKRADIGVAMGLKGSEAAKEAAEMVLADDNFASIAAAVEEGRTVYDNLKKTILFILPTNGGEALTIIAAILLGRSLPVTPVQILWINLITAVTLGLALAFEAAERDVMRRPPRRPDEPILSPFLVWRIGLVSILMLAATFGLFLLERTEGASLERARTVAVNTLVICEALYLFSARFLHAPSLTLSGLFGSRPVLIAVALVVGLQIPFTYWPVAQSLFGTVGLDAGAWARILLAGLALLLVIEAEKAVARRYNYRNNAPAAALRR